MAKTRPTSDVPQHKPTHDDIKKEEQDAKDKGGTNPPVPAERPVNGSTIGFNDNWDHARDLVGGGTTNDPWARIAGALRAFAVEYRNDFRQPIWIDLADLRGTEQTYLDQIHTLVAQYNTLKGIVEDVISQGEAFFGGEATITRPAQDWSGHGVIVPPEVVPDARTRAAAKSFTPRVHESMRLVLNGLEKSIEALGAFTAMLNTAGQAYTQADKSSVIEYSGS